MGSRTDDPTQHDAPTTAEVREERVLHALRRAMTRHARLVQASLCTVNHDHDERRGAFCNRGRSRLNLSDREDRRLRQAFDLTIRLGDLLDD